MKKKKQDQLRDALKEVSRVQMDKVLERGEYDPEFTRRMLELARQELQQKRSPLLSLPSFRGSRVARRAASVLLVGALSGGLILAASPSARAYFFRWIREVTDNFAFYSADGEAVDSASPFSAPTWIPSGYSETSRRETLNYLRIAYSDLSGNQIIFYHYTDPSSVNSVINREYSDLLQLDINGSIGDLYLEQREHEASTLVWSAEDDFFVIHGDLDPDTFLNIALNVN